MEQLDFATTNPHKLRFGQENCRPFGIELRQLNLDIDEIQGEDPRRIVIAKAMAAFAITGSPVVVSDDSWVTPALGGFPGAYMKSINHWFTPQDFLRLMQGKTGEQRKIELHAYICYTDGVHTKVFGSIAYGRYLEEVRGTHKQSVINVISMDQDGGKSLAEVHASGTSLVDRDGAQIWQEFCSWYNSKKPKNHC